MKKQLALGAVGAILIALAAFFLGLRMNFHPENQKPGKFPEQLVYVRSADDVVGGGVLFTSTSSPSKPLAIIWVHRLGSEFLYPELRWNRAGAGGARVSNHLGQYAHARHRER
jgi:hypothetical protein